MLFTRFLCGSYALVSGGRSFVFGGGFFDPASFAKYRGHGSLVV